MKKLMYLSISMLCLAITLLIGFHIGSQSVKAQAPEPITGFANDGNIFHTMLQNGDVWVNYFYYGDDGIMNFEQPAEYRGNFWSGGPVPISTESWGGIKGEYEE